MRPILTCLGLMYAMTAAAQTTPTDQMPRTPGAGDTASRNGIVKPAPNVTRDPTVKPGNVDPRMSIVPPGAAGNSAPVVPK